MSLFESNAQQLIIVDPSEFSEGDAGIPMIPMDHPLEVTDSFHDDHEGLSVAEEHSPAEVVIELGSLPGAPEGTEDPQEPQLEVVDEEPELDENDAKKPKKNEKWDWESHGPHGFVAWIKTRIDDVPKHSGYDSSGLERAVSYLDKLDSEISKAMRLDLDGELDANKIEEVRSKIDDGISKLHDRLDKVRKNTKGRRKKKSEAEHSLVKEGQKITGVQGVYITVPLLISGIGRVCINGMISAGHDIESTYADQVKKWALNEREKAEVRWFLYDMGYPMRGDRGYMPDEEVDPASSDNFDWQANYKG
jgi:ElaB/YqjD/DUF883 family membrane-anchored ribosome-binding protein